MTARVSNEISSCEVCGSRHLAPVLDLGPHPMCDDLVPVGDDRVCREYPIEILFCTDCLTAHQRFQVPKQDLFPVSYHYRSRFTADVLNGMVQLVDTCEQRFGSLSGKKVLDVGCNDGSLLDRFRSKGAVTVGIEPTDASVDARGKGHDIFNSFFSVSSAREIFSRHGGMDFITFTNVFAHIEDLHQLLESLKILMTEQTVIAIENHYLGAVFEKKQFDTFYHEHPRTYSYTSFVHIARSLGVHLLKAEFPSRYGGNIRVFLGKAARYGADADDHGELSARESRFLHDFATLRNNMERWRRNKRQSLERLVGSGLLRAKAFPGRAAILVKLLGLDDKMISAVYEKPGSMKIGHYVPGTRIPIRSDEELFGAQGRSLPVLNLAWHISAEIRDYLTRNGYTGPVIDIITDSDFA